jgi:DNA replication and repair protein RecF
MLQTLEINNIRSYVNAVFEFADGVTIIVGPNGSGKTSLLESVYIGARGESFKGDDRLVVSDGKSWGRIDMVIDNITRTVKLQLDKKPEKSFSIDGTERRRLDDINRVRIVLFEPQDMQLVGGEPDRRRSYLDGLLSSVSQVYEKKLKEYRRALQQRNRLLKQPKVSQEHVFAWDIQLSSIAGALLQERLRYSEQLDENITDIYQQVSGTADQLRAQYESKIAMGNYQTEMMQELKSRFELDRIRGFTSVGPHRDDLKITLNDLDVRKQASRGETRSIVLALKITELRMIEQVFHEKPLLLLDDVFSELDGRRRRMLALALKDHQTLITTTDADVVIEHFSSSCNIIPL